MQEVHCNKKSRHPLELPSIELMHDKLESLISLIRASIEASQTSDNTSKILIHVFGHARLYTMIISNRYLKHRLGIGIIRVWVCHGRPTLVSLQCQIRVIFAYGVAIVLRVQSQVLLYLSPNHGQAMMLQHRRDRGLLG
jgi:hypothetical protein